MADPHAGKRIVTELPTALLLRYCEVDRAAQPRHGSGHFWALVHDVRAHGISVPVRLRYDGVRARVVNGMHRLAAARIVGIPSVPVALEPELHPVNAGFVMTPGDWDLIVAAVQEHAMRQVRLDRPA